jgi:hypothetical protein
MTLLAEEKRAKRAVREIRMTTGAEFRQCGAGDARVQ